MKRLIRTEESELLDFSCPANILQDQCCYRMGKRSLVLVRDPKTWKAAAAYCKANFMDGRLVSVHDTDWQTGQVERKYEHLHVLGGLAPPDGAWIGLNKEGLDWTWTDGTLQSVTDAQVFCGCLCPLSSCCTFSISLYVRSHAC